jgi:hypothetical protein
LALDPRTSTATGRTVWPRAATTLAMTQSSRSVPPARAHTGVSRDSCGSLAFGPRASQALG